MLHSMGSRSVGFSSCGSWALERRLSSCGPQVYLLCGMWDLPGPGIEPVSPTLAGRFLTTVPPGKPGLFVFLILNFSKEDRWPTNNITSHLKELEEEKIKPKVIRRKEKIGRAHV